MHGSDSQRQPDCNQPQVRTGDIKIDVPQKHVKQDEGIKKNDHAQKSIGEQSAMTMKDERRQQKSLCRGDKKRQINDVKGQKSSVHCLTAGLKE